MLPLMKRAIVVVDRPTKLIVSMALLVVVSAIYPSDLTTYTHDPADPAGVVVHAVDQYGRFINTALQVALPLLHRDPVGAVQLVYIAVSATAATHGMKRLLNDWRIGGTRLGQRPSGDGSKHNSPSGHSSMASCAVYFVCRRYGLRFAWVMVPVLALTMYARVALNAHTVSAVLCGALIGFLFAAIFTSRVLLAPRGEASVHGSPA
jgi:membrane-associated phospholipid phosphatase